ncbi:multidrug effflux MFS transporter [Puniceibacterium sediminis]|uniref:Bcr/CflA family efflux transporter n=1 Tax=Puniceibacterium sediminis TaxID=1608407 RepID=A0A238VEP2_9RHOB|nr:multidrug effflux MFS transporter [Puniceibacterium sediminis]SNR32624.1 MFS transporter, DHA1 family, bicyclomycin/chloramphenicol resistance protein [Puniceibacterium sediminis]
MTDQTPPATPLMSARRVSLIGALLVAVGPVSMAIYTPAMTELVHAFGVSQSAIKMTLTLYFGGFAVAQLVAGPLSDALGRRPIIIAFMGIYCAASVFALFAPNVETLMAARFLQGIGASAGVAISRALVRDLFKGEDSSRIMNLIGIILALGPALAPTLGGVLLGIFGWRSTFVVMLILGLTIITVATFALRETVTPDRSRLNVRTLGRTYLMLLTHRHFMTTAMVMSGALGALYAQATFLPFILMDEIGLTPAQFGLGMLMQSGFFFTSSLTVRFLMGRVSAYRLVAPGLGFILLGSLGTLSLAFGALSFLHVMIPVAIYAIGIAFIMPAMSTAALAPFGREAGSAASMMGFLQMGSGLLIGSLGALMGDAVLAMALLIPLMGAAACIAYLIYRSHPHLAEPEPKPVMPAPRG